MGVSNGFPLEFEYLLVFDMGAELVEKSEEDGGMGGIGEIVVGVGVEKTAGGVGVVEVVEGMILVLR